MQRGLNIPSANFHGPLLDATSQDPVNKFKHKHIFASEFVFEDSPANAPLTCCPRSQSVSQTSIHPLLSVSRSNPLLEISLMFTQMMRRQTCFAPGSSPKIPMYSHLRPEFVGIMEDLAKQHRVQVSTLNLAVRYMDEIFTMAEFKKAEIRLIIFTCFHLAVKFEEHFDLILPVKRITGYLFQEFSASQVMEAEQIIFRLLGYSLHRDSPLNFVQMFLALNVDSYRSSELAVLATEIAEMVRNDYNLNFFEPYKIAAAIMFYSRLTLSLEPWPAEYVSLSGLSFMQIRQCFVPIQSLIYRFFDASISSRLVSPPNLYPIQEKKPGHSCLSRRNSDTCDEDEQLCYQEPKGQVDTKFTINLFPVPHLRSHADLQKRSDHS